MNRRNRKKKTSNLFDDAKQHLSQIDTSKIKSLWQRLPKAHQIALMVLVPFVIILLLLPSPNTEQVTNDDQSANTKPVRKDVSVDVTSLSEKGENTKTVTTTDEWKEYTVQSGDTLSKVFRANDLPMAALNDLVKIEGLDKPLSRIQKGQLVRFKLTSEGDLDILQLEKSGASVMFFRLSDGTYGRSK